MRLPKWWTGRDRDNIKRGHTGTYGLTDALARAARVLDDPRERMAAAAGNPSAAYVEAYALRQLGRRLSPEEVALRAAQARAAGETTAPAGYNDPRQRGIL